MIDRRLPCPASTLVAALATAFLPSPSSAANCSDNSGVTTCTLSGTYSVAQPYWMGASPVNPTEFTSSAVITATPSSSTEGGLQVVVQGGNGNSSNLTGGDTQGLTLTNSGNITLQSSSGITFNGEFYGLNARQQGGNAISEHSDGGNGGVAGRKLDQIVSLTNHADIHLDVQGLSLMHGSGAAISAVSKGGVGAVASNGKGGAGGQAVGAQVDNTGNVTAKLGGGGRFAGIQAISLGGAGADDSKGNFNAGGGAGSVQVTHSGNVDVEWTWADTFYGDAPALYGILAEAASGRGGSSSIDGNGGDGGKGYAENMSARVILNPGGSVKVTQHATPPNAGAGVAARLIGGRGGDAIAGHDTVSGGNGGHAGAIDPSQVPSVQITNTGVSVVTSGDRLPALSVLAQGGDGSGTFDNDYYHAERHGGAGGRAGDGAVSVTSASSSVELSTAGNQSPGIQARLAGGSGGSGGQYNGGWLGVGFSDAGDGGWGGGTGSLAVSLSGSASAPISITTSGDDSPGIYVVLQGGAGGKGGGLNNNLGEGRPGHGGAGGGTGNIDINLVSTHIATQGPNAWGVVAQAKGAAGADGGRGSSTVTDGSNGGAGGSTGHVNVTLGADTSITARGDQAGGVIAQTVSGAGGSAGDVNGQITSSAGHGGAGGNSGNVTVSNAGQIRTEGTSARGILAQSIAGAGGAGGDGWGIFYSTGGDGASSGKVGEVTVSHTGSVTTSGGLSHGILAHSIGGAGGAGGDASGVAVSVGGNAASGDYVADASAATVYVYGGSLSTAGSSSMGAMVQSIGGGGGDGGGSYGAVSIGASGGKGGRGAQAYGNLSSAQVTTSGETAHGVVAQSIGGGGGNAGNAVGVGLFASAAVGASGGDGGGGGPATLNAANSQIVTSGARAAGLVVQSIGGGGGTGGPASTLSVSPGLAQALAVGGSGSLGGDGGPVSSQLTGGSVKTGQVGQLIDGTCEDACLDGNLLPVDSFGVVVQSIGGGGGMGGTASAQAVAISFPVTPTGDQVGVAWAASVGGSGGEGGDGNYVTFAATEGAEVTTSGQGAHGVMVQSIGGGGGQGGDSSALAAVYGYGESVPEGAASLAITPTFSLGGSGATAGNGGPVWTAIGGAINVAQGVPSFVADGPNTAASQVTTYGDFANAIHAQSIGGGGGNAGMGSGPTQSFGTGASITAAIQLGGTGGAGGDGDEVRVEAYPVSQIRTFGSNAAGILAHSIGGGGGTSQGGALNVASFAGMKSGSLSVAVGRTGGAGGKGGPVTVNVGGAISTDGADAPGVHAQSIGGGGGLGGSAGSDASADNPVLEVFEQRHNVSRIKELVQGSVQYGGSLNVSVGGQGGAGNTADTVDVNLTPGASIRTNGDWSMGVMAQSVGGGGGKGGVAAASGLGSLTRIQINANVAVGGSGGSGANGGNVQSTLDGGTVTTAGYGATGVFLHSIGGGGGWGADGSDGSWGELAVGKSLGGSGGRGGNGGVVVLTTQGSNVITTQGEAAFGTLLQSVGGSGGFAGAGSRYGISPFVPDGQRMRLAGGDAQNQQAGGTGAGVALNDTGGLQVATAGNNAIGVMVQSVGGGGGIVANAQSQVENGNVDANIYPTSASSEATDGGEVSVNLPGAATIRTAGTGAHGVVAQTVGGGGGLIGLPGTQARLAIMPAASPDNGGGHGRGGNVTVHNAGLIEARGTGAVGILAQTVSGGGGLLLDSDGHTVLAGSASRKGASSAKVDVQISGRVASTGPNGIGVFAQNVGGAGVAVQVDGAVEGGTDAGVGVWVDSSAPGTLATGAGGSVQAASGNAIFASSAPLDVVNQGTISGSVDLAQGSMDNRGTLNAGAEFKGELNNSGILALGSPLARPAGAAAGASTTVISGDFHQTPAGALKISPDFLSLSDTALLHVTGDAVLDGRLEAQPVALLPGRELHVMSVEGRQSGTLRVQSSPVIQYSMRQDAQHTYMQVASASFDNEAMQLSGNPLSVARHLQQSWDSGGSDRLAPLYASFDQASREGAASYRSRMAELSPTLSMAPAVQTRAAMVRFTDAMMSCPASVGEGSALSEQDCVWGQITGRRADEDGTNGSAGYSYDSVTYQVGGQRRIAQDWVLGGSLAYQTTKLRSDNGKTRGSGDTGYVGLVLKREMGPWTVSTALAGSYGSHDVSRRVTIPAVEGTVSSRPDVYGASARLRVARNFDYGTHYLKPYVDLSAHYTRMPGYTESAGIASLKVDSSDQFVAGLTPALEVGGRMALENGMMLRPYAYAGVSLYTNTDWEMKARLAKAPPAAGTFTTELPGDTVVGRVGAGLHLMKAGGVELRLQYDGEFASKGNSHAGSLRLNVPF